MSNKFVPITNKELFNENGSTLKLNAENSTTAFSLNYNLLFLLIFSSLISCLLILDGAEFYRKFSNDMTIVFISALLPELIFTYFSITKGRDRIEKIVQGLIIVTCFFLTLGASISKNLNNLDIKNNEIKLLRSEIANLKSRIQDNKILIKDWHKKGWVGNVNKKTKVNSELENLVFNKNKRLLAINTDSTIFGISMFGIFGILLRILFSMSNFVINRRIGDELNSLR